MMKNNLEQLLSYTRDANRRQTLDLHGSTVSLSMDYKMILMSNYVSKRVIELSGKSLEISFMYGGNVKRVGNSTQLDINDFYIPPTQSLQVASFDSNTTLSAGANNYFAQHGKRTIGIGHSHAEFDIFHSPTDHTNYQRIIGSIGVRVSHPTTATVQQPVVRQSFSQRLGRVFNYFTHRNVNAAFSYVMPSLVFNAHGRFVDSKVAIRTYVRDGATYNNQFSVKDIGINLYNKQAVLTDSEKTMLDHSVRRVLAYNGLLRPVIRPSENGVSASGVPVTGVSENSSYVQNLARATYSPTNLIARSSPNLTPATT